MGLLCATTGCRLPCTPPPVLAQIANAKNPGYFTYYKAPPHIVEQEHASELETRTTAVAALQERLEAARGELEAARERRRLQLLEEAKAEPSASSGLEAWFAAYGRPAEGAGGEGYRTAFKASPKMHGGSKHYPAFKSGATVMRVGRMMK